MKIRSKALYTYLFESGVLNKTPEEIDRAKRDYRKLYKNKWKQQRQSKEIRIDFTTNEFTEIKRKASTLNICHTMYARRAVLSSIHNNYSVSDDAVFLEALQLVSMVTIALLKDTKYNPSIYKWLANAETLLLHYYTFKHSL